LAKTSWLSFDFFEQKSTKESKKREASKTDTGMPKEKGKLCNRVHKQKSFWAEIKFLGRKLDPRQKLSFKVRS
jgi:hypothetical protein